MEATTVNDAGVTWPSPDASITWVQDGLHAPTPVSPLIRGLIQAGPMSASLNFVNGYLYTAVGLMPPPPPEVVQRGALDVWENDYLPRIKATCERIRGRDYDSMPVADLVKMIPVVLGEMGEAFFPTLMLFGGYMVPSARLIAFCERELGSDGARLAATVLQGFDNETRAAGARLAAMAEYALAYPEVAACLLDGRYDSIATTSGGPGLVQLLSAFLADYGWRASSFWSQHERTWAEAPDEVLDLVARYVREPSLSPTNSIERAVRQREETVCLVEGQLDAGKLPEFRSLLAAAQGHVPISEGRARWQLTLVGSCRVPIVALGRKLVATGAIADANDIFYLTPAELAAAAANPGRSFSATVEQRQQEQARWSALTPPPLIGPPPDTSGFDEREASMSRFFVGDVPASVRDNVISGVAASGGLIRGKARVILDLAQGSSLEAGEILVCRSTAPPWTPLFAIAGGVVTDSGGLLSHSAICAREYAIPCVVATRVATTQIPDGAWIILDGNKGTITIES